MNKKIHRRKFLNISAAAVGVAAAGSKIGSTIASESTQSRPVRLGVVGLGGRGTGLLDTLLRMDGVEVPALCDINEQHLARAHRLVEKWSLP